MRSGASSNVLIISCQRQAVRESWEMAKSDARRISPAIGESTSPGWLIFAWLLKFTVSYYHKLGRREFLLFAWEGGAFKKDLEVYLRVKGTNSARINL